MKRLVYFFFLFPVFAGAQSVLLHTAWTDGFVFYTGEKYNDSLTLFYGGTMHEAGYAFLIKPTSDPNTFLYAGSEGVRLNDSNDSVYVPQDEKHYKLEYKIIDGIKTLIAKDLNGNITDTYVEMTKSMRDIGELNMINFQLAGKYVDRKTGKEITFYPDKHEVDGLTTSRVYIFEEDYDFPQTVLRFDKVRVFYYEVTDDGLELFTAKKTSEYGDWDKDKKLRSLKKVEWFNLSGNNELKGKYQFASTIVLIDDILSQFNLNQLAIMRNEILARYGYIFKTTAMKTYFQKQDWYKSSLENVDDKLTRLEKLNIELIKIKEQKLKEELTNR